MALSSRCNLARCCYNRPALSTGLALILYFLQWLPSGVLTSRRSEHLFVDIELIKFVDPMKNGFHIILSDEANQYLIANPFQLPAIYITAIPLDGLAGQTIRLNDMAGCQIRGLDRDCLSYAWLFQIHGLEEKSWYYICLEYETVTVANQHNETTSTHCKIYRTLDRFGKTVPSTISEVQLHSVTATAVEVKVLVEATYPLQLTTYLESGTEPTKVYILESPKTLSISFIDLLPNTAYGRFCVTEEPLMQGYTLLGRSIQVQQRLCFIPNGIRTASRNLSDNQMDSLSSQIRLQLVETSEDEFHVRSASTQLTGYLFVGNTLVAILLVLL